MVFFQDTRILTDEVIDTWSAQAEETYRKAAGKRASSTVKLRLTLEEILLRFRESYGTNGPCIIRGIKSFSGIRFELAQQGARHNPLIIDPDDIMAHDMLAKLNLCPQYAFRENRSLNIVTVPAPIKPIKNALLIGVLCGVVLAVLTWFALSAMPGTVEEEYMAPLISALFSKLSSVFSALATPLVFFAVIAGIVGIGDITSFGKLGIRLVLRMLCTYGIAMIVMVSLGIPMGLVSAGKSGGENVFSDLLNLVLDIIPGNLVEPFRIDNDLQVIVLGIFIGLVMLTLGEKIRGIRSLIDEFSALFNRMMMVVCKLLPLFVYLGITNLLLGGNISRLGSLSKIVVICLAGMALLILITIIRARIVTGKSFLWMFSAQLPALVINLTTSSQVSALPESMKCCKERWKIDEKFTDFALPLGIVVYMPNGAILLGSTVWVLTDMAMGGVSPITLVKLVFVAVIVAIAAPPIPGSAVAVLPILFSATGTDLSMMPLAVIIASTIGYLLPAVNGYCLQLEILMSAWKSGVVKREHKKIA